MSDYFPKYGATLLNAVGVSRFEVTFDGECIYSSDDASMDDGLLRYIAQLREQLAKAKAERPMTNDYAYHRLASQVEYAINLLDGNEDELDYPCGELVEKLIDHLNHYESVKCQLAKAEAEAKRHREAWIALRSYVNSELTNWDIRNGDRWLQTQLVAGTMDDLLPPTEQGTTHD